MSDKAKDWPTKHAGLIAHLMAARGHAAELSPFVINGLLDDLYVAICKVPDALSAHRVETLREAQDAADLAHSNGRNPVHAIRQLLKESEDA